MLFSRFGRAGGAQVFRGEGVELRALRVDAILGSDVGKKVGVGEARAEHVERVGSDLGELQFFRAHQER